MKHNWNMAIGATDLFCTSRYITTQLDKVNIYTMIVSVVSCQPQLEDMIIQGIVIYGITVCGSYI